MIFCAKLFLRIVKKAQKWEPAKILCHTVSWFALFCSMLKEKACTEMFSSICGVLVCELLLQLIHIHDKLSKSRQTKPLLVVRGRGLVSSAGLKLHWKEYEMPGRRPWEGMALQNVPELGEYALFSNVLLGCCCKNNLCIFHVALVCYSRCFDIMAKLNVLNNSNSWKFKKDFTWPVQRILCSS